MERLITGLRLSWRHFRHGRKDGAVYLDFRTEGRSSSGSGFFLNMPSMREHELILTSAQNLMGKGNEVEDLRISDANESILEIVGQWYCPAYRRNRKPTTLP